MDTFITSRDDVSEKSEHSGGPVLFRFVAWIEGLIDKRRSRIVLMELNDEQLKDIGISRSQAYREASRPFWE